MTLLSAFAAAVLVGVGACSSGPSPDELAADYANRLMSEVRQLDQSWRERVGQLEGGGVGARDAADERKVFVEDIADLRDELQRGDEDLQFQLRAMNDVPEPVSIVHKWLLSVTERLTQLADREDEWLNAELRVSNRRIDQNLGSILGRSSSGAREEIREAEETAAELGRHVMADRQFISRLLPQALDELLRLAREGSH